MVEGARLEIVYALTCIGGSNPPLSARFNLYQDYALVLLLISVIYGKCLN